MSKDAVNNSNNDLRKENFDDTEGLDVLPDYEGLGADSDEGEGGKKGLAVRSSGFKEFMLNKEVYRAVLENGFEHPSEVQHECIPEALLGRDLVCQAKSGMGKTAVFVIAVLHQIRPTPNIVSAIVLGHTRELAFQITKEFERFAVYLPNVVVMPVFGGVSLTGQKDQIMMKYPNIVVGCPGRVKALGRDKILDYSQVKHFVMDECDKMLAKMDMRADVQEIFRMTLHNKQTMMFSATMSRESRLICKKFLNNPKEVYVDDESKLTLHGLVQHFIMLTEPEKNRKLCDVLDALDFNQVVIFVKSVMRAKELNSLLKAYNFPSTTIHRGMDQNERLKVYRDFKEGQERILVATDLFGRGIDIERVNIVINYDMPETTEHSDGADTYLHRVGRAGRFGTKGLAITFIASEADSTVLNRVQERFDVCISAMPNDIDPKTYMNRE